VFLRCPLSVLGQFRRNGAWQTGLIASRWHSNGFAIAIVSWRDKIAIANPFLCCFYKTLIIRILQNGLFSAYLPSAISRFEIRASRQGVCMIFSCHFPGLSPSCRRAALGRSAGPKMVTPQEAINGFSGCLATLDDRSHDPCLETRRTDYSVLITQKLIYFLRGLAAVGQGVNHE